MRGGRAINCAVHLPALVVFAALLGACGNVTKAQRSPDVDAGPDGSPFLDADVDAPAEVSAADAEAGPPEAAVPCANDSDCPIGVPAACGGKCVAGKCAFVRAGTPCNCPLGPGDAGTGGGACNGQGGCVVCPIQIPPNYCTDDSACCVWYDPNSSGYNVMHPYDYGMCGANHECQLCIAPGHYCDQYHKCCTGDCDWTVNRCP